ncbi:MAG: DUF1704 domain-containing protein [Polyangiaceae bacterium]
MLTHFAPANFEAEVERLTELFAAGGADAPAFVYNEPPRDLGELRGELEHLARALDRMGVLGRLYAERANEIALEAAVAEARETPALCALAIARFGAREADLPSADALARAWLSTASLDDREPDAGEARVLSDDLDDPRSLLRRLRGELEARGVEVRVQVARSLVPLAAVGEGMIFVAPARSMTIEDVERTVLHEVEGHVLPSVRARMEPVGLGRAGSARGADTQEGLALLFEERHGFLRGRRRVELAARHLASRGVHEGRDFIELVRELVATGVSVALAVRSTARAFRGGGLGREATYLPAFITVERVLAASSRADALEAALARGRLSLEAVRVLEDLAAGEPAG